MLNTIFILSFISGMPKKLTTEQFIEKAREVHGDKYDYSLTKYILRGSKLKIICPEHGEFEQVAGTHLNGHIGCKKCAYARASKGNKLTTEQFIERARKVHGDKYDYSLTKYIGIKYKIKIICPKHGEFEQNAYNHLQGNRCNQCNLDNRAKTTEQFIEKAREVHGDKYDYSLTDYVNRRFKVKIICPEHGEFEQLSRHHSDGKGCPYCTWYNRAKRSKSFDSFKAYFVKLYDNDGEVFYKIGVTYRNIKRRLRQIPYKYEIINVKEIKDINDKKGAGMILDLESRFKKMYKNKKYTPKKEFKGMGECFSDKIN